MGICMISGMATHLFVSGSQNADMSAIQRRVIGCLAGDVVCSGKIAGQTKGAQDKDSQEEGLRRESLLYALDLLAPIDCRPGRTRTRVGHGSGIPRRLWR